MLIKSEFFKGVNMEDIVAIAEKSHVDFFYFFIKKSLISIDLNTKYK